MAEIKSLNRAIVIGKVCNVICKEWVASLQVSTEETVEGRDGKETVEIDYHHISCFGPHLVEKVSRLKRDDVVIVQGKMKLVTMTVEDRKTHVLEIFATDITQM
jgi:hypothetical protein